VPPLRTLVDATNGDLQLIARFPREILKSFVHLLVQALLF